MKMNIKILIILFVCILVFVISGYIIYMNYKTEKVEKNTDSEKKQEEITEEDKLEQDVKNTLANMTLDEKIGQMLMIFYENDYTQELDNILKTVKPGGFVVFSKNVTTYKDTVKYISKVKENAKIPMLIGIDQEGGRVQRIKALEDIDIQTIPPMLEIGKSGDSEVSYNTGKTLANQISLFGINTDFAPVLDIFSNPNNTVIGNRAFGTDAKTVISMALPFAKGMESENIIPVYKHFPGHGDTNEDSHVKLPVVTKTKEQLYQNELLPFKEAIKNNAQMIMVAHIALPNITGDYKPATLSKEIIDGILRNELGFNGVVITDAINMKALDDNYSLEEICKYSINAGVDIILMPLDPIKTLNVIKNLVKEGSISEARINESVKRILTLKYKNGL